VTKSRIPHYLYLAGLFFLVPVLVAFFVVWLVAPDDSYISTGLIGWIRVAFRDQRVPVGILIFTVVEVGLWRQRYALPWSELISPNGRSDIPPNHRMDFERAAILLDEAERLLEKNEKSVQRDLSATELEELQEVLETLRGLMDATPFEPERFQKAFRRTERHVETNLGKWRKGEAREYGESIAIAIVFALVLRFFVVEAFKIPSGSMIPTLQIGDHIFVNKMAYGPLIPFTQTRILGNLPPKRGDVMVFEFPENRKQDFIKRVIATGGDLFEVKGGHPIINGWTVPNCKVGTFQHTDGSSTQRLADLFVEYLGDKAYLTMFERDYGGLHGEYQGPYHVKKGEVWVMGDNRNNSHDSRGWFEGKGGGVPFENIKGRALFVWLSFAANGRFAWDRLGVQVMGMPRLPPEINKTLGPALEKCFRDRPPLNQTTPPPPPAASK
jgi:signal peptidase I